MFSEFEGIVDSLDDQVLAGLEQAAHELVRAPRRHLDRAGLVALAGRLGDQHATLVRAGQDGPVLVILRSASSRIPATFDGLSAREREVAGLISHGLTNRQIAQALFLSVATVKDHVHHILSKSGMANRSAIAGRWRADHTG